MGFAQAINLRSKLITWASNGFDRDHEAGEAGRMEYVKFQH